MAKFEIAGILFEVTSDIEYIHKDFDCFSSQKPDEPDMKILIRGLDHIEEPTGRPIIDKRLRLITHAADDSLSIYIVDDNPSEIISLVNVDSRWSCCTISYLKNHPHSDYSIIRQSFEVLLKNHILLKSGMILHAAAIEWEGKGIAFSAPSETGKSTQAYLWGEHMGSVIINGDHPAVRIIQGRPYVFGTPWSGSKPEFLNRQVPLTAIVLLQQHHENIIRKLSNKEAALYLLPQCFLPYYDRNLMVLAMENVEKIIASTDIYLLKCRPDKEAVELLHGHLTQS